MQAQNDTSSPQANGAVIALLYSRIARDDRSREDLSMLSQLADTRGYALRAGWIVGGEYDDVSSGKSGKRESDESFPGYRALLDAVRRRCAEGQSVAVVVKRLDRLGRSVRERAKATVELGQLGASIHSVAEGGLVPEMIASVLVSVAEDEVRLLGDRVAEARRQVAGAGWFFPGVAPWGYRWRDATADERTAGAPRKALEEDPATAPFVREAYRRAAEGESIQSVARWVQALPEAARGGRRMSYQAVRFILRCPTYISRAWPSPYDGRRGRMSGPLPSEPGRWPALVDEATWHRAQDVVKRQRHVAGQRAGRHLLSGYLRCPSCGSPMNGRDRPRKDEGADPGSASSYHCRGVHYLGAAAPDPDCQSQVPKVPVDAALLTRVGTLLDAAATSDPRVQAVLRADWRRLRDADSSGAVKAQIEQVEREAERYRYRLTEGARLLVDGLLDRAGYERLRVAQEANLQAAEAEIARLREAIPEGGLPPFEDVLAAAESWAEALREADVAALREVLALLVERVVPVQDDRGEYDVAITWTPLGAALAKLVA